MPPIVLPFAFQVFIFVGLFCFVRPVPAQEDWRPIRRTYENLHSILIAERDRPTLDNLTGGISWGWSYLLESYLEMYDVTGDEEYLVRFIHYGDRVMAARADLAGKPDFKGRLMKGWLAAGHYTHQEPVVLLSAEREPSLRVQGVPHAHGSNNVSLEVIPEDEARDAFTIRVVKDFRNEYLDRRHEGLTMDTVEGAFAREPGDRDFIRVERLGDQPPARYQPFTAPSAPMVFHGHHTGNIVTPFARFVALVHADPNLGHHRAKADEYLARVEETLRELELDFRTDDDGGYFILEKSTPAWFDGIPEPLNCLAATGSAYLWLHDATGDEHYLEIATRLARRIKKSLIPLDDGTFMYHYWYGIVHDGWDPEKLPQREHPRLDRNASPETMGHLQHSVAFIVEAWKRGIVFERPDLERLAATFNQKIYKEDDRGVGSLSYRVDGTGSRGPKDFSIAGLAQLGLVDPSVYRKCRSMYEAKFRDYRNLPQSAPGESAAAEPPNMVYAWSVLARVEHELNN